MKILQQSIKVKRHSRVNVHFSRPCSIYLMTEVNFKRYKEGASFRRLGGEFQNSPAEFTAPYDGTWHAVIEKGSHFSPQQIDGRVEVLAPLMKETAYFTEDEEVVTSEIAEEVVAAVEEEVEAEIQEEVVDSTEENNESENQEDSEEEEKD